jgi:two-component system response regulator YesN
MVRIMVVEDDLLTRIGIVSMLKEGNSDLTVIAEADNGKTALEISLREEPDIIITDVKMPLMNGIELIRAAKEAGLKTRFVILSSYNDFEYVREGVLLGAEDYLLKLELDKEKLITLLDRIALATTRATSVAAPNEASAEALRDEHSKACCVYNLVTGRLASKESIATALTKCDLAITENNLLCILAQKEFSAAGNPVDTYAAAQTLKTLIGVFKNYGEGYGCIVDSNLFCLVGSLREPKELAFGDQLKNELTCYMQNTLDITLRILVSGPLNRYQGLTKFFVENCKFENNHYFLAEHQAASDSIIYNFAAELSLLENVLHNSNIEVIATSFDALLDSIARYDAVPPKMLHSVCYILIHFTDQFYKSNPYIDNTWSRSQMLLQLNTLCRKPVDYTNYILKLKNSLITDIQSCKNYNSAISRAQQFIKQNYARDLSLEEVAASINLVPAYFSRLFSQITGASFINYLTDIRIQHAKELLQGTDAKIREISETVGYSNIYYFSRVFKNRTGATPVEYRRQKRLPKP